MTTSARTPLTATSVELVSVTPSLADVELVE
jgi:hypothetical protein